MSKSGKARVHCFLLSVELEHQELNVTIFAFLKRRNMVWWVFVTHGKYTDLAVSFCDFNGQVGILIKAYTVGTPSFPGTLRCAS